MHKKIYNLNSEINKLKISKNKIGKDNRKK